MAQITLTTEYMKQTMARSVPLAYYEPEIRGWVVDDDSVTPRAAAVILQLFPHLAIPHPKLPEIRDKLIQDVRPFDNATEFNTPVKAEWVRGQLAKEGKDFYRFQELDLGYISAVLETHGGAYLGWERGMGKTLGAYAVADTLDCEQVMIVAPNTAKLIVWYAEALKYWPYANCIEVLPNDKRRRDRCAEKVLGEVKAGRPILWIVHYEALDIIGGKGGRGWTKYGEWDLVVSDETHRIKNPKAKMTRALKKIPAKRKLALSGSIIQNHAEELFSPLQWLFPDRYRSKWRDWNDRFLDYVDGGYSKVFVGIKQERLAEMREELGVFMVYRRKEDELDLPDRVEEQLFVEISPAQRKAYDQLVATCMTKIDDVTVRAMDGLPMLTKLRQIATGLDLVTNQVSDSTKLDVTMELIEDNEDESFVVFSWYKAAVYALEARLKAKNIETVVVTGDVKAKVRAERIEAFQSGEWGQVFLGTISTLGESVNLQRANNAIFLDRSWNPAANVQAADRIYRIGQDKKVTITHLIAKDTVDEHRVLPTIVNKEALRALILGG